MWRGMRLGRAWQPNKRNTVAHLSTRQACPRALVHTHSSCTPAHAHTHPRARLPTTPTQHTNTITQNTPSCKHTNTSLHTHTPSNQHWRTCRHTPTRSRPQPHWQRKTYTPAQDLFMASGCRQACTQCGASGGVQVAAPPTARGAPPAAWWSRHAPPEVGCAQQSTQTTTTTTTTTTVALPGHPKPKARSLLSGGGGV